MQMKDSYIRLLLQTFELYWHHVNPAWARLQSCELIKMNTLQSLEEKSHFWHLRVMLKYKKLGLGWVTSSCHYLHCTVLDDVLKQVPSWDILHHKMNALPRGYDLFQIDYIRVLQLPHNLHLMHNLLLCASSLHSFFVQELHNSRSTTLSMENGQSLDARSLSPACFLSWGQ